MTEPQVARIPELSTKVALHWECPPDGTGMAGMFTVGLAKHNGFVVTLDGQGADEQLAGYECFIPSFLIGLPPWRFPVDAVMLASSLGLSSGMRRALLHACAARLPWPVIRTLGKWLGYRPQESLRTPLNECLLTSIQTYLVNLLHYADSRSMFYSIESRMPFMDHRLIEFNLAAPANYKIHNGYTKYYARLAFDSRLPSQIVWRRDKMGWPLPEAVWLATSLRPWFENLVLQSALLKRLATKSLEVDLTTAQKIRHLSIAQLERVFFGKSPHASHNPDQTLR